MTILENIFHLYIYFYKPRIDSVLKQKTKIINKKIYIEFDIVYKDKDYNLVFVSDTNKEIYNDLVDFNNNKINHILKKNMIVYASLNDTNDNFIMDITDEIRKFCFYFDKQKHVGCFLHYLQDKYINLIKNNLKIYNLKIYKNDEYFSENTYNIQDIMYIEFNKIMV